MEMCLILRKISYIEWAVLLVAFILFALVDMTLAGYCGRFSGDGNSCLGISAEAHRIREMLSPLGILIGIWTFLNAIVGCPTGMSVFALLRTVLHHEDHEEIS